MAKKSCKPRKTFFKTWAFKLLKLIALILLIFTLVLLITRMQSLNRENKTIEEAAPIDGKFMQAYDTKIFYQEVGQKGHSAVIFIHGTGSWSDIWREQMIFLEKHGYYSIAIDIPPFGFSEKPYGADRYNRQLQADRINDLIVKLELTNLTVVCHSVGCSPTMEAVLKSTANIKKIVLVDPALGLSSDKDGKLVYLHNNPSKISKLLVSVKPLRNAFASALVTNPILIKKLFSTFVYRKDSITDERVNMIKTPLKLKDMTSSQADWLENLVILRDDSLSTNFENFKNLEIPVFLIWGKEDTVTPLWQGYALNSTFPKSKLTIIDDVGHIPYIENEKQFNEDLLNILSEI